MNQPNPNKPPTLQRVRVWSGWIIVAFITFTFGMSGFMKLKGGPELDQGMAHLGLPQTMVFPLAILELTCLAIYLVPQTAALGAVLLTGYLGGAICTHWRVGDPFIVQCGIGVLVWLGLYLREKRLWPLIPVRSL